MSASKTKFWPQLLIVCATLIWGSSFLIMKQSVDSLPVFFLLAVRFSAGTAILAVVFWRKWKLLDKQALVGGAVLGALMFAAYVFQTYGLSGLGTWQGTTPGKNAFFTAIYCVIVPFLSWLFFHKLPDRFNVAAALLCICGIGFVSLGKEISFVGGDFLTLLGGVAFSLHIIAVAHFSKKSDIILLTILQFLTMALLSWVGVLCSGQWFSGPFPFSVVWRLVYLSVAATALAMLFQNVGQAHTPPAMAAVLMSLEAPFGVLFSVLFGPERPTAAMYTGFALIFFAVILSETKLSFLPHRKKVAKGG